MKTCTECGEEKPLDSFHIDRGQSDHRKTKCRICTNKVKAAWRAANSDRVNAQKREHYEKYRDHYLAYMRSNQRRESWFRWKLMRNFGITPEDFDRMMQEQGGCCAICGMPPHEAPGHAHRHRLHVDHDHVTGKVRGLLCNTCNVALGALQDSEELLIKAAGYIARHKQGGGCGSP